jgi:galactokinase
VVVACAPGRVNLIGDHTDYQDGYCLPMAIDRKVRVAFAPRADGRVVADSGEEPGTVDIAADGSADPPAVEPAWGRAVAAVVHVLAARGRRPVGFDAHVRSDVPVGAGLSSSAAFEVACTLAGAHVAGMAIAPRDLALAAQEAEHFATGVPCGVMDQMASVFGRAGHALFLDCRTLAVTALPLPADLTVTVVHSGLPRRLETSAYAQRRGACEAAAARLGIAALRDAPFADVADDPIARHVVSENARVLAFVDALREHDLERCGELMLASHASLRDDFAVSTPELDLIVELALAHGALGARLTGAGFGGCIVAITRGDLTPGIADDYGAETGNTATVFRVRAADGARVIDEGEM